MHSLRLVRRFGIAPYISTAASTTMLSTHIACPVKNSQVSGSCDTPFYVENSMVSENTREPIKVSEPALLKLKKERNPEKLFRLFKANAHNKLVIENRFAFEDTVSRLAGAGRFDYIENLLEHQKTLAQGRREGFIIRIIMLYGMAGMTKHAIDTFYNMHLYGCKRTVKSFNATLKVLTQSRDIEAIKSFLSDAPSRFDIDLDEISCNVIINALCGVGLLHGAYLVMIDMERRGMKPDVVTYTTIIASSYKSNDWVIANGLWNRMLRKGCVPNVATFNARIQFLVNKGQAWEANKLLGLMRQCRIMPDDVTYNLVIKGFFRAGLVDMAKTVYSSFNHEGYKPNQKINQTMIHYLCRAGDFDLAYTIYKSSTKRNWYPSVHTIHELLRGLQKDKKRDKIAKAKYILLSVRKKVPAFSDAEVVAMRSILSAS